MALILEATGPKGTVTRLPLTSGLARTDAVAGTRYRIVDDAGGRLTLEATVKRVENDLLVENLPRGDVVQIDGFFERCPPENLCTLSLDGLAAPGAVSEITPASEPVAALRDGSFVLVSPTMPAAAAAETTPAALAPEGESSGFGRWAAIGGGVALLGLAGGGGGGGGTAVSGGGTGPDNTPPGVPEIRSGAASNDRTPVISGTAEPNARIVMSLDVDRNGSIDVSFNTTADANGNWAIDTGSTPSSGSMPAGGLAVGSTAAVTLRAVDGSGNLSPLATGTLTIDQTPPTQTAAINRIEDDRAQNVGVVAEGGLTNDDTPTISGTVGGILIAGETVAVFRNGVRVGNADVVGTDWSFREPTPLASGNYTYTASVSDEAGNTAAASGPRSIAVDADAPGAPVIDVVEGDNVVLAPEAANGVSVTGSAEPGSVVTIAWLGPDVVTRTDANGDWSAFFAASLVQGTGDQRTIEVTATDAAGNTSAVGRQAVTLVTGRPSEPSINIVEGDDLVNGAEAADGVVFSGSTSSGTRVDVRWNGVTRAADVSGNTWSVRFDNVPTTLGGGGAVNVPVTATATDSFGNVSAAGTRTVRVDAVGPATSITAISDNADRFTGIVPNGGTTNDTTPTISGTSSEPAQLTVLRNGVLLTTFSVNAGTWTLTDSSLPSGSYTYTVRASDPAGNTGATSAGRTITVDATAPIAAITAVSGSDVAIANGGRTPDTTPTLSGTSSEAGQVELLRDGVVVTSVAVSAAGTWVLSDPGTTPGDHVYSIRAIDAAGNVGASSAGFALTVFAPDTAPPGTPTINPVGGADGVVNAAEASAGITLTGAAEPNSAVSVTWGGITRSAGTASASGSWSVNFAPAEIPASGNTTISAIATDAAGNRSVAGSRQVFVDRTPPSASIDSINDNVAPGTGVIGNGGTTNDTTPTLSGSASELGQVQILRDGAAIGTATVGSGGNWSFTDPGAAAGAHSYTVVATDAAGNTGTTSAARTLVVDTTVPDTTPPATPTVNPVGGADGVVNAAEAGAGITLTGAAEPNSTVSVTWSGTTRTGTATAGGTWSIPFAAGEIPASGNTTISAIATDAAGNRSVAGSRQVFVDRTPPSASIDSINDNVAPGTGVIGNGGTTNDTTPTLSGSASELGQVQILRDGAAIGTATVGSGGNWSFTDPGAAAGAHSYTVVATDAAGNTGTTSAARTLVVDTTVPDTTPPGAPAINPVGGADGVVSIAEANAGLSITGTAEAGSTVSVSWSGTTRTGTASAGGTWSIPFAAGEIPGSGNTTITATATDAAGNRSNAGSRPVVVDRTAPSASIATISDNVAPDTGAIGNGGTTNDTTPTLSGSASELGQVQILRDGAAIGTATVGSGGNWSFTDPGAAAGAHSYTVVATDAAGNTGAPSAARSIVVDTTPVDNTPPTIAITSAVDDEGAERGNLESGDTTDDTSPLLRGTVSEPPPAGQTLQVFKDGQLLGNAQVAANGTWTIQDAGLTEGRHVYSAQMRDAAGNLGTSNDFVLRIDVTPSQLVLRAIDASGTTPTSGSPADGAGGSGSLLLKAGDLLESSMMTGAAGLDAGSAGPLAAATSYGGGEGGGSTLLVTPDPTRFTL